MQAVAVSDLRRRVARGGLDRQGVGPASMTAFARPPRAAKPAVAWRAPTPTETRMASGEAEEL
jgi:hypothetical protein